MDTSLNELYDAVVDGQVREAERLTRVALAAGVAPQDVFNQALVPAMSEVGRLMEINEYYIPEVLVAAKAMKAGTEILKPLLLGGVNSTEQAGTVVMGTVRGDLHDIGKNLVVMMLEGAGFRVVDLGVDVPAARFVEAAGAERADIVALSALLTTTMLAMREVIQALDEAGLREHVDVIIGGAPVQQSFANEIGADGFALNAAAAVTVAQGLMRRNN
jgi:5-methyltetrahydrofolate--homocysteine methyltransferase